jgi:soluble lytic murein transglycosylase-like protein
MIKFKIAAALSLTALALLSLRFKPSTSENTLYDKLDSNQVVNSAPSIQMYFYIKKYAKQYNIPEAYAFSLAYQETRYQGPLHLNYNYQQISSAGALGPMQIMPNTALMMMSKNISERQLKSDIDLNVKISMKLLRYLYNQYGNWGLVFGAYNTGSPCINDYARNILNKEFIWKM